MCDFCLALVLALPRPARIGNLSRETAVAFARSYVPGVETAIAFAVGKWAFLVRILFALVLSVSTVAVQRRAVVMGVSCWPASVAAEVSLVAKSPRAGSCARKSSPCAPKTPQIRRFYARWASFFTEMPVEGRCWASFIAIQQPWEPAGELCCTVGLVAGPLYWQC